MTVCVVIQCTDQAVCVCQRPKFFDLINADQFTLNTDGLSHAFVQAILIHTLTVCGQAQVTAIMETNGLAGFGLELLVQLNGVLVKLANRVAHVKQRQ